VHCVVCGVWVCLCVRGAATAPQPVQASTRPTLKHRRRSATPTGGRGGRAAARSTTPTGPADEESAEWRERMRSRYGLDAGQFGGAAAPGGGGRPRRSGGGGDADDDDEEEAGKRCVVM